MPTAACLILIAGVCWLYFVAFGGKEIGNLEETFVGPDGLRAPPVVVGASATAFCLLSFFLSSVLEFFFTKADFRPLFGRGSLGQVLYITYIKGEYFLFS